MSDIVLEAMESWDGFTFAAVKDRSTDFYHVVMIQKDGTTIRSKPTSERNSTYLMKQWFKLGYIPGAWLPEETDHGPEAVSQHPLFGRF